MARILVVGGSLGGLLAANILLRAGHQVQVISFPGADPEHEQSPKAAPPGAGRLAAAVAQLPGVVFEMAELGYNAITLLRVNKAMRTFRPELIYEHAWRRGDLLMWDNRCTIHARTDFPSNERRMLRRLTIEDAHPVLAGAPPYRDTTAADRD